MTVQEAELILLKVQPPIEVVFQHRFAGDKGTILRLDNYAMVNIFDDGRYYIQGQNTDELVIAFGLVEEAWDPETWSSILSVPAQPVEAVLPWIRSTASKKRFEF